MKADDNDHDCATSREVKTHLKGRIIVACLCAVSTVIGTAASHGASGRQATDRGRPPVVNPATTFAGRVTSVVDGDTLILESDARGSVTIRIEGIDCPELGQPFSQAARNFTRQLTLDRVVSVRVLSGDRYGRLVARAVTEGKDVSVELVKAGLAWHFSEYSSDRALEAAEREARSNRRGLWADTNPTPPWVQRRRPARAGLDRPIDMAAGPFHANVRSGVYHSDRCKNARCGNCSRAFTSEKDAQAAGFRPAGDCLKRSR